MINVYMSFEELVAEFPKRLVNRHDKQKARRVQECIYEKFMRYLGKKVEDKYTPWLKEMRLTTCWSYGPESFEGFTLEAYEASFAIIFETELMDGYSDYEPLITFIFDLDESKYNEAYIEKFFERMDARLSKCLRETYGNWMIALHKYHWHLFDRFGGQVEMDNPIKYPEEYFLTHKTIVLD